MADSSSSKKRKKQPEEDVLDHMGRKVWDKDYFMEKAKQNIMFGPERIGKRKDPVIPLPSSQRTYLKARDIDLQLEKDLGKSKTVTAQTIKPMQGGYWCSVCECLLKDSSTYLEHVNGRRHNRNLGMNMKVEKVGADRVRERLNALKKKDPDVPEAQDVAARLAALEEAEQEKKRRRKEKQQKKRKKGEAGDDAEDDDAEEEPKKCSVAVEGPPFEAAEEFQGPRDGYSFKMGDQGLGYYREGGEAPADGAANEEEDDDDDFNEELEMLKQMGLPTGFS
mmetsp:Transcript_55303/g.131919  ORF Transcript_55303/g.131919 Transcript_55303/m.131919 type:complete len:279 (+) Transcript_55303:82-918(+)|eukprot:CAMPEP_0178431512 /NCGR_PEP_ID=MMETSP0689_2-20121128/31889_1 /TAXON_ID=160604 /ORGANISM="Amphidinium massartii, Strain CS-259" /LENGTH=278 /DNA_ID=CAMNT_0020053433 /DNA_START=18 /DNA_END=854 /DNA_ORIENTATION=-